MGPTLARMAKRAAPGRRVIGVARFSDPAARGRRSNATASSASPATCSIARRCSACPTWPTACATWSSWPATSSAPPATPSLTWMMNVGVPAMVAETFREMRIVAFSTACVYPFVPVDGAGRRRGRAGHAAGGRLRQLLRRPRAHVRVRLAHATARPGGWCACRTPSTCATACSTTWPARCLRRPAGGRDDGPRRRHLAGRRQRAGAAPARALHDTGHADQRHRPAAHQRALAGRRVRPPLRPRAGDHRAGSAHRLARSTRRRRRPCSALPRVPLETMIDWVADWVRRGGPSLGKPTHFSTRDGKY